MMTTRIMINGEEVTNPFVRGLMILGAIIVASLVTAVVIFVLLPIIGVAVTLSLGFIVIFVIATVISVSTLALVVLIFAWMFGAAEFRIEKKN